MDEEQAKPDRRWATVAIVLIAVGVVFFFGEVFNVRFGSSFWPLLILVPGLIFLASAFGTPGRVNPGLAGAGAVLTTLGLIFFYQNSSGNWESWAYVWALLPLSVGISQIVAGSRNDDQLSIEAGRNTARMFAIVFAVGLVFFELIIFDRGGVAGYLLPVALIIAGGAILWAHYRRGGEIPFADTFRRPEPPGPIVTPPPPAAPAAPPAPRPMTATAPPPATAAAPPPAATPAPPAAAAEHFPEDELPEPPPPDEAPFPLDEEAPADAPSPAKPRRVAKSRKSPPPGDGPPPA